MTALQNLDRAEIDFRDYVRATYEAPALVYQQDSALIEQMALKIRAFSESMAADISKLHARDNPNPTPVDEIAELVADSLDRDLNVDASRLLTAQVRYLAGKVSDQDQKVAA